MSSKDKVQELLDRLPKDCSLDEIQYHLYVLEAVEAGRAEMRAGKGLAHEDVARELRRRWQSDHAA